MDKNEECAIVKDLAIPYAENIINLKSKTFVNKHLLTCNDCKKYYNDMNTNILMENQKKQKEQNDQQYELDFLKKFRKHMSILRISLVSILIVIACIIVCNVIKYQKLTQVINKTYNKIEFLKTLDNYTLTKKELYENYEDNSNDTVTSNYYYKNGKYKITYGNTICYSEDNSYNKVYIYCDLRQIDYYHQNFIEYKKGCIFNTFTDILFYKTQLSGIYKLMLAIRSDKFNNIDCYVIRNGNSKSYKDMWINKNTFEIIRIVENNSGYYREELYTLSENNVSDKDVNTSILDTEPYNTFTKNNIENNATEEIKRIYDKIE